MNFLKYIIVLASAAFVLASCSEGKDDNPSEARLESLTIKAEVGNLSVDIDCTIDSEVLTIAPEQYIADGTTVVFDFKASGTLYYGGRAILADMSEIIFDSDTPVVIGADEGTSVSYRFEMPDAPKTGNQMTEFTLQLTVGGVENSYAGAINDDKNIITVNIQSVDWIDNIGSAVATFSSTGDKFLVEDVEQVSGITQNNFTTDVVYTVVSESGIERNYTIDVLSPQSSGNPVVRIDTEGGAPILNKEDYVDSKVTVFDGINPDNNIEEAVAGVRGRGNNTWGHPKKPYRVKFDDKTSVFGLGEAKNWVLLADWLDPTFLMNHTAFELAHRLGMAFAPTITHVEFFLNGAYQGSYSMCEHIQVNEERIDIDEFEDAFLELDDYWDEANKFRSAQLNMPVNIKSPEFEDVSDAERDAFIATLTAEYNAMESAVMSLTGWRDHIDVASFIDFMIVNELTRNSELYWPKSTNMYKKQGGKWTFGPVWDFDWAYGYTENGQNHWLTPESLMFIGNTIDTRPGAKFFNKLFEDAGFRAEYKARWNAVKAHLSDIDYFVDTMGAKLAESDMHNKQVWGSQYTKNYEEQIESMRTWLRQRIVAFEANVAKY